MHLRGVISVESGYTGGSIEDPTYEQVCQGNTGHVEVVKITYDPAIILFDDLLSVFFNTHDPTSMDRQGDDVGSQYRSVIFYQTLDQKEKSEALIAELNSSHAYERPVVTMVLPLQKFYHAEDYQKNFYETHKGSAYCELVIAPKLDKLQERFKRLMNG